MKTMNTDRAKDVAEPIALVVQGKDTIAAFACGKCRYVVNWPSQHTEEQARNAARLCCGPFSCACGVTVTRRGDACTACSRAAHAKWRAETLAADIAKAKPVRLADYDGEMVYLERDDRAVSTEELEDLIADGEAPPVVWGCTEHRFSIDADDIITSELEEHHEDARDYLDPGATEALQKALDAWRDEYAYSVRSFFEDRSVRVVIDEEEALA